MNFPFTEGEGAILNNRGSFSGEALQVKSNWLLWLLSLLMPVTEAHTPSLTRRGS